MSWQQRDYAGADDGGGYSPGRYHGSGLSGMSLPTILIIANVIVYFLTHSTSLARPLLGFGIMQADAVLHGQVWRLFTATYLHANFAHIFANMIGLYFFGPALERIWGSRQFLLVYTLGGIAGNIVLTLAGLIGFISPQVPSLGASGSVLTLLGAAAVLFPNARIFVYFLFPIRIRTFVLLYGAWFAYNILHQGRNYGGDLCHVGGLLVGLWWAHSGGISLSGRHRTRVDPASLLRSLIGRTASTHHRDPGPWDQRRQQYQADTETVDRILAKVHEHGLHSLTPEEKHALEEASRRRQEEEDRLLRSGRP